MDEENKTPDYKKAGGIVGKKIKSPKKSKLWLGIIIGILMALCIYEAEGQTPVPTANITLDKLITQENERELLIRLFALVSDEKEYSHKDRSQLINSYSDIISELNTTIKKLKENQFQSQTPPVFSPIISPSIAIPEKITFQNIREQGFSECTPAKSYTCEEIIKIIKWLVVSVVLFYIVLYLTRLHRYYIKLGRHYKDRKVGFELAKENIPLEVAMMIASSAHIDFNMPKMPTDILAQYFASTTEKNVCCCCCCKKCKCDENKKVPDVNSR